MISPTTVFALMLAVLVALGIGYRVGHTVGFARGRGASRVKVRSNSPFYAEILNGSRRTRGRK